MIHTFNTWTETNNNGDPITINEIDHKGSCHAYQIINEATGTTLGTIYPDSVSASDTIRIDLNNGESVNGWHDFVGNTVDIDA